MKRKKDIRINERDMDLMRLCHEQRFLSLSQIARTFWPESKNIYKRPLTRVNQLMGAGYLRAQKARIGQLTLYLVAARGLRCLKDENLARGLPLVKSVNWFTYEHDLWVTDVRLILEKLGFEWIPERVLKGRNPHTKKVFDGRARTDRHDFAIEVERTMKNRERYEKLFPSLCRRRIDGLILYIVKDQEMLARLKKYAGGWTRIYFVTMEELKSRLGGALFLNCESKELVLDSLIQPDEDIDWDESLEEFRVEDREYRAYWKDAA